MKNDPWFQFTLNNWSQPDQSLPFLKMLLHPSMYFSMSPTTFFILSDSSKYLYFLQVLPCSKHLLIELSTKNSFSQSCKITYLRNMEWIAAQLKFNCLLGKSKIWCTNEFSYLLHLSDLPLVNFHELSHRLVWIRWAEEEIHFSPSGENDFSWSVVVATKVVNGRLWAEGGLDFVRGSDALSVPTSLPPRYSDPFSLHIWIKFVLLMLYFFRGVTFSFPSLLSPPPC